MLRERRNECKSTAEAFATDFTLKAKLGVFTLRRQTISVCEWRGSTSARKCENAVRNKFSYFGLSASLIGRSGSSTFKPSTATFQTIHHCSVDVAHGLVLLFGIGTRGPSTMGFENEAEQSNGRPYRQIDDRSKRTNELTSSIVPRGTSFHRSVELGFSPIACDPVRFSCCCRGLFPGPAELGAVNPYAVHDHSQPPRRWSSTRR